MLKTEVGSAMAPVSKAAALALVTFVACVPEESDTYSLRRGNGQYFNLVFRYKDRDSVKPWESDRAPGRVNWRVGDEVDVEVGLLEESSEESCPVLDLQGNGCQPDLRNVALAIQSVECLTHCAVVEVEGDVFKVVGTEDGDATIEVVVHAGVHGDVTDRLSLSFYGGASSPE